MNFKSLIQKAFHKAGYRVKKIRHKPRASAATRDRGETEVLDVMRLLHKTNPYDGFDFQPFPFQPHSWGMPSPAFRELILQVKPRLVIEVGTWKGSSALEMAAVASEQGLATQVICVDTWLGASDFWSSQDDPERYISLQLKNGFPTVYYQFLANVCHKGLQDRIIPFPQTASGAALWFWHANITAEMIYIDASHDEEEVYQDLCNYWAIVAKNGVFFGDDYYSSDGVRRAVHRFAKEEKKQLSFIADKWILRK